MEKLSISALVFTKVLLAFDSRKIPVHNALTI